ncbi:MAG: hypothetical protein ACR2O3_15510 [Rhizobiaceae bacterium]
MFLLKAIKNLIFGTACCLTPFTAVIALGWLMRYMQSISFGRINNDHQEQTPIGWIMGPKSSGFVSRCFGGIWQNAMVGMGGTISLLLATLPFTGLWLLSWWAGWENSFNKGYEQAWVGPVVGFIGVAIGLWVLAHLPIGLAHQATENRWFALFELRRVRQFVGLAGWRYVALSLATVLFALPVFAARGLPVFIEGIVPGFSELPAQKVDQIASVIALMKAGYVFVALVILRRWSAQIYADAVIRSGGNRPNTRTLGTRKANWFLRTPHLIFMLIIWFGFVFLIFSGQFLNNSWLLWINHPFLVLPWLP